MYSTKFFAFSTILMIVLVQLYTIQFVDAGKEKGDTIIMGGCGKLIYKGGKKSKGHTIIMGGGDCGKKESHHHHYSSHY
ncbi:hypothetical protein RDWZM_007112 [Blomia tropicalis]|uniref:Uncharacterized protein n=1 Tax=Blomia tropicalis TaxID=40697 RepID=A0A9Q0MCK1_BLOTA|nr:hypothetical protein RDWZM_007112 [Blomia tropicalis]